MSYRESAIALLELTLADLSILASRRVRGRLNHPHEALRAMRHDSRAGRAAR